MFGVLLLVISLYFYFKPQYRHLSYFIYLSFLLGYGGGFGLTTDAVLGVKNKDLAIVYTFLVSVYLLLQGQYKLPRIKFMRWFKVFICFLICSIVFSYAHYGFSFFQILQGGRDYLLLFSLPIIIKIKPCELARLMPILLWVTAITSVLYIMQIIFGQPLMPYSFEPGIDATTGLIRLYNIPPLLGFFLALTFVVPEYFGKRVNVLRVVFFVALICTMGRTGIFSDLMVVMLSMLFLGKASKLMKTVTIVGILFVPFIGMISNRFEKGGTDSDISTVLSGGFSDYGSGDGGTMTYRIAWIYERAEYLANRPIGEQIFGLGLISDSQPLVHRMYNFHLGLREKDTGLPTQLSTPDIAYGNILSKLGFGGGAIYLSMLVSLAIYLFKKRKANAMSVVCSAMIILAFAVSMAGTTLSQPQNLVIYFLLLATFSPQYSNFIFRKQKDRLLLQRING